MGMKKIIRIWDLPIRLFHWLLVICIIGSIISVNIGGNTIQWHAYFGYCILTLVIFRIVWGWVGSTHARFIHFIPSRARLLDYVRGRSSRTLGHNPLAAFSVLALLGVLLIQAITGLFADDEIAFQGPLAKHASEAVVSFLSSVHGANEGVIYGLIAVHLAAIFYYQKLKGENLIRPMISGDKEIDPSEEADYQPSDLGRPSRDGFMQRAFALMLLSAIAVAVAYVINS
jgi:cytochrome b